MDERQSGEQADRFKNAARELGCDEDEKALDEKLKGIARQKPNAGVEIPPGMDEAAKRFERNLPRNSRDKD